MEVVGRDDEIRKVEIALTRRDKNNVVLLGDGGVGKSAIVDGIAMRIARDEVLSLKGKKILQFSLNDLSATFGVFSSECIKRFIEEMKREKDVILFIDEVHMLGRAKHLTDLLKPLMGTVVISELLEQPPRQSGIHMSQLTLLLYVALKK